jgi:hypothetical protein
MEKENVYRSLVRKRSFGKVIRRYDDNIKMGFRNVDCYNRKWRSGSMRWNSPSPCEQEARQPTSWPDRRGCCWSAKMPQQKLKYVTKIPAAVLYVFSRRLCSGWQHWFVVWTYLVRISATRGRIPVLLWFYPACPGVFVHCPKYARNACCSGIYDV